MSILELLQLALLWVDRDISGKSPCDRNIAAKNKEQAAKNKEQAYETANEVLRSVYIYMKTNQLHINLSKCAHMYFRLNLHYKERLSCARITGYDQGLTLSVNGQKVKKAEKVKLLGVIIDETLPGMTK